MTAHTPDGYTEFRFFRPDASQVFVAGDFNNWRTDQVAMTRQEGGWWCVRLPLPAGQYRFRYFADGQWFCDFAGFGIAYGPFGPDGIVRIPGDETHHAGDAELHLARRSVGASGRAMGQTAEPRPTEPLAQA
jgi:1,4-alpha-glucan branching enzyme